MFLYLVKFTHKDSGNIAYKRGISKWGQHTLIANRFGQASDPRYSRWDIELVTGFQYSRDSRKEAQLVLETIEQVLNGLVPPKDPKYCIEEHFGDVRGDYDGLSGITEMIVDHDEEFLKTTFDKAVKYIWKVMK